MMNIESLITVAKSKISGRVPRYIDLDDAAVLAYQEIVDSAMQMVHSSLEEAILGAQSVLKTTCQEYIEALYIEEDFTIGIRSEARHLEYGYPSREMAEDLLASPKAKTSKDGDRYMVVPVDAKKGSHVSQAISKKASELFSKGKKAKTSSRTLDDLVDEMRNMARSANNTSHQKAGSDGFRTVSDKQDHSKSWVHPGFAGVNQLDSINGRLKVDLEEMAARVLESQVDRMRR